MKDRGAMIIPGMRYEDAPGAIEWLCKAFGFERGLVVPGEGGTIVHAQLTFGNGMVMLGSTREDELGRLQQPPKRLGGVNAQGIYVVVDDPAAHYRRALDAGAVIVREPEEQEYGGSLYQCTDPEGYLWSFGSYDPWVGA